MPRSPLKEDLKELAWAIFLLDLIALGAGLALARVYGMRAALLVGGGFAALVTGTLGAIAAGNLLVIGVHRLRDRAARRTASLEGPR